MYYWLKRKESWLKGYSVNQRGIDFTNNLIEFLAFCIKRENLEQIGGGKD